MKTFKEFLNENNAFNKQTSAVVPFKYKEVKEFIESNIDGNYNMSNPLRCKIGNQITGFSCDTELFDAFYAESGTEQSVKKFINFLDRYSSTWDDSMFLIDYAMFDNVTIDIKPDMILLTFDAKDFVPFDCEYIGTCDEYDKDEFDDFVNDEVYNYEDKYGGDEGADLNAKCVLASEAMAKRLGISWTIDKDLRKSFNDHH